MGLLNRLGIYIGSDENLMRPTKDNPEGYWENQRIMELHDQLLERLGGSWHEPPELQAGWEHSTDIVDLLEQAKAFISNEFGGHSRWGWKDPRTCILLPFWQKLIPDMKYVICIRNPLDVAASLQARDGFPLSKSLDLWTLHTLKCLEHTKGKLCILVFYERFNTAWRHQISRLAGFIGVDSEPLLESLEAAFHKELYHHRSTAISLLAHPDVPLTTKALYYALDTLQDESTLVAPASSGLTGLDMVRLLAKQVAAARSMEKRQGREAAERDREITALRQERDLLWETNRNLLAELEQTLR